MNGMCIYILQVYNILLLHAVVHVPLGKTNTVEPLSIRTPLNYGLYKQDTLICLKCHTQQPWK